MQSHIAENVPAVIYKDFPKDYKTLNDNRRNIGVENIYQELDEIRGKGNKWINAMDILMTYRVDYLFICFVTVNLI